jgi:hypothetical protein
VSQIPGTALVVQPLRGSSRSRLLVGLTAMVALLPLATSAVQAQSEPNNNSRNKAISATSPATPQEVAPRAVVPTPPRHAAEEPTRPAVVAWDGQQLTIDAENSTLADILVAVKNQTGATIDMPGAAWGERVFVHLGPGPPRDIVSSLIYGLPFDYVVETAEDDPNTLRSVVLTPQGQGDSSNDVVVAGAGNGVGSAGGGAFPGGDGYRAGATGGGSRPEGARMMRGWSSSGKTTFQSEAEAALAAKQAAAQEAGAEQAAAADQPAAPAQDSSVAQDPVPAQDSARAPDSVAGTDVAEATKASNSTSSTSDSNDQSGVGQAIQNMTNMFEQRRQIQQQQNQTSRQQQSPND